jgi:peroxiredoxin Q/BCP
VNGKIRLLSVLGVLLGVGTASAADLAPGSKAPDFALAGSDGREHRLADYVGKHAVVLAWVPEGLHPGLNGGTEGAA